MLNSNSRNIPQALENVSRAAPVKSAAIPSAEEGEFAPINLDELVERCLGHLTLVERVLANFEQRFLPDVSQIEAALAAGDAKAVGRLAHQLKGASANVAAKGLQEIVKQIEDSTGDGLLETIPHHLEELRREWERVSQYLAARSQVH